MLWCDPHTNLGRSALRPPFLEEFQQTATQYSNLEYDVCGRRAAQARRAHLAADRAVTGAEAAIVVNNCAPGGAWLTLAALARRGEVIVSRRRVDRNWRWLRIQEIYEAKAERGGCREVGTTNRTRIADYENAINEKTRDFAVSPSNFTVSGFTEKPIVRGLVVGLGKRNRLSRCGGLGSGCLVDFSSVGINEPTVTGKPVGKGILAGAFQRR